MGRMGRVLERPRVADQALADGVTHVAQPLTEGHLSGYDPLIELIRNSNARIVLIGEASHGTHEFYRERARITTRLIMELGFSFVAVEGDWPEAYHVNKFVQGGEGTAREVLNIFDVYPTWMWGNLDTLHFIEWLRRFNDSLTDDRRKVGFFGLDLYSLFRAMQTVIDYLERVDPQAAETARQRYACFEPFSGNKELYAHVTGLGLMESCEDAAVELLRELQRKRNEYTAESPDDTYFNAVMSAEVARDSERYYRSMYRGEELSWNLRDIHMTNTLDALLDHFGSGAKAVVWAHNTHVGDFRATADADGMVNIGQLVRERHPGESIAIGFGTYEGTVTASRAWGDRPERMHVPAAMESSYDRVFHATDLGRFLLVLKTLRDAKQADGLNEWRGQRAIGVVYHPEREGGNYVPTQLANRYDAYIHIDRTRAVKPLAIEPHWTIPPMEDTYPTGY